MEMRAWASPGPMGKGRAAFFLSFGNSAEFDDEEDRQAAMTEYEFDNTQGDYITCNADLDDLFEDGDNSTFPPKVSDY